MLIRPLLLAALVLSLSACACPCNPKPIVNLPAPISPEEQASRLAEWSHQLPNIQARTVLAGVRLEYRDDKGQNHTVNAEGFLQIHQHFEAATTQQIATSGTAAPRSNPADVLLLGSSFDQPAFEAGRNAKDWWFAIRLDTKKAWVGDATHAVNFAGLGDKDSASILRADLVPDLLGLTEVTTSTLQMIKYGNVRQQAAMLVDDATGTNHLYVIGAADTLLPATFISREIIVDRRTGHITEVRLYNPDGILAVRSILSDYVPVTYARGMKRPDTEKSLPIPQFPRKVTVSYPGQFLTVALEFDTITLVPKFDADIFTTPDFKDEGLRIIPTE